MITEYGTVLQVGNQVVDDEGRGKNLARGKDQEVFRIYKVEQANGPWLWLVAEGSGVKGWAPAANVIPLDQAIDHFTNLIRANPGAAGNYLSRANVWQARKEFDIAIADYNEAIRLEPNEAVHFVGRGIAWNDKKEYDKAIADYNEAIRLDPKDAVRLLQPRQRLERQEGVRQGHRRLQRGHPARSRATPRPTSTAATPGATRRSTTRPSPTTTRPSGSTPSTPSPTTTAASPGRTRRSTTRPSPTTTRPSGSIPKYACAYHNRGYAWYGKKEYDKAIADYNEAIRLDPKDAMAYYNRGCAWSGKKEYDKAIADYNEAIRLDPGIAYAYYNRGVAFLLSGSEKASDDARKDLELEGWRGGFSQYAVLWGHFGSRRAGKADAARGFLDDAAAKCDTSAWPYPVIRYLRGEIDPKALLAAATDTDKMTEARCYLGLDLTLKGQNAEAREHLLWVKEHGVPTFTEYTIAVAELERLEKANQPPAK